jgi:pimeloyl-ACP methyl ester carboxylesterase
MVSTMLLRLRNQTDFLSYAVFGPADGYPLLVQHGLIAGIQDSPLFQRLLDAGLRLVCAARPGYGLSSPILMPDLATWGQVSAELADHLGLKRFDLLGMSSGAPYCYAIAAKNPTRVRNVYIFSGTPALYHPEVAAHWPFPLDPHARLDDMRKLAYDLFFAHLSPQEREQVDIRDSMANDCFGIGLDFCLRARDWGFPLEGVSAPVFMRHSRGDDSVPLACAQITARLLPNCRLEVKESAVHFSPETLDDFFQTTLLPNLP